MTEAEFWDRIIKEDVMYDLMCGII